MLLSGRFNEKVSQSNMGTIEDIKHECLDALGLSSSVDNIICIEPPYKLRREGTDLVLTTLSSGIWFLLGSKCPSIILPSRSNKASPSLW